MSHVSRSRLLGALLVLLAACSSSPGGGGEGGAGAAGNGGAGGNGPGSGGGGSGAGALGEPFRHGVNFGFRNPSFTDPDMAMLASEAGADSARLKLPEYHLEKWGWDIEAGDMQKYQELGMSNQVAFLIGPSAAHSTAPDGTPSWQLDEYIPKNLYQPVFLADGAINPDNYWGKYVFETVSTYKTWVRTWEVWNEPDWVSDWQATQTWGTQPPTKEQLVRFHGSIFDYVRMLRVTYEAARKADPQAKIALGGLGYPTFLSAVLRYTDNPADGSVSAEYPETGAKYFDVVSYHYYPLWTPGSSDEGVKGFLNLRDDFAKVLADAGVTGKGWVVTETGASHEAISGSPSGTQYAVNYLLKVMTSAQAAGVGGVDWFALSDGADIGASKDAFAYMGLYLDVAKAATPNDAQRTDTGWAYRTHGELLGGARFDAEATAALALPATLGGAAFRRSDGREAYVLWARAEAAGEDASATYELATSKPLKAYAWDHGKTGESKDLAPSGGKVTLQLGGAPQIFVEE
ncbi:hypothetical protein [Polyangium aurulentum]|uniref:hypothetical protein n=1 Tax=Polyangium aurulentum TaxID=2567896 RepID=UPI0010AE28B6|nr:hypothetical protein [Polyangium aurulentum]UQA61209.1 hypothetical protein E8A73_012320 [Polyangium aurulentum]